jgi:hypothetical protein
MTVRELIESLKNLPQDLIVVVEGLEGGFDNIEIYKSCLVFDKNFNGKFKKDLHYGRHDFDHNWNEKYGEPNSVVLGKG